MKRVLISTICFAASAAPICAQEGGNLPATRASENPAIAARIQPLLPASMRLREAAAGFRNQAEFLEAVHVSHNLDVPFHGVKEEMAAAHHHSVAEAIQALRPGLSRESVKLHVRRAEREAKFDLQARAAASTVMAWNIAKNPTLAGRVSALLPEGVSLEAAAVGFRSQAQFLAALHAARNLRVPFSRIQERVVAGESLERAIVAAEPELGAEAIRTGVHEAMAAAQEDAGTV
jgi:hypothetical protein